jgi:hypothetical protein
MDVDCELLGSEKHRSENSHAKEVYAKVVK